MQDWSYCCEPELDAWASRRGAVTTTSAWDRRRQAGCRSARSRCWNCSTLADVAEPLEPARRRDCRLVERSPAGLEMMSANSSGSVEPAQGVDGELKLLALAGPAAGRSARRPPARSAG